MNTVTPMPGARSIRTAGDRRFDGIICFGGIDWWYHSRGHYDPRMMLELAKQVPVLYVNSIGLRTPSPAEGSMFARRLFRKLSSLMRGGTAVGEGFRVHSPVIPPNLKGGFWARCGAMQVRYQARQLGITRPLIWIACPPAFAMLPHIEHAGVVFQRTDKIELYPGADPEYVENCVDRCLEEADLVIYCNRLLQASERLPPRNAVLIDHGLDGDRFLQAGATVCDLPELESVPHPRVGYVGGMDRHRFDSKLVLHAARSLPDVHFFLVGGMSLPAHELNAPNIHLLGPKPYGEVHRYMAAADVLIIAMPDNEWIRHANPVKLKEYLAVGRPVVSTNNAEVDAWCDVVRATRTKDEFVKAIQAALREPHDPSPGQARVREHTWNAQAGRALEALAHVGLAPVSAGQWELNP